MTSAGQRTKNSLPNLAIHLWGHAEEEEEEEEGTLHLKCTVEPIFVLSFTEVILFTTTRQN